MLRIASSSEAAKTGVAVYEGELVELAQLSESTIAFGINTPAPEELVFLPGQYVNVSLPGTEETRSYSFSSPPMADIARFVVRNVPGGK